MSTTRFYPGLSGGVGTAGTTGTNPSGAPCQSSGAAVGNPGRVTTYMSFN